ncbi:hypothetical protein [Haloarcula rubripromontorii]|uniref:hypothetical protein n=1 Tax=Haloarcula rubripromontorii TaxID=1705562 RepID=UPI00345BA520
MDTTLEDGKNLSHSTITLEQVRRKTKEELYKAVNSESNVLLDSEPGSGKTTQLPETIEDPDTRVLYTTAREELYNQMERLCEDEGVDAKVVPRLYEDCPVFASSPDTATEELAHILHGVGVSGTLIHEWLNLHSDTDCQFVTEMQDFDPEQHQVLIGHYTLANLEDYTSGRTVVVDEFPEESFITHIEKPQKPVTEFLKQSELPYSDWTDLLEHRNDDDRSRAAKDWFLTRIKRTDRGLSGNPFHVLSNVTGERHVRGAFLTASLLFMDDLGNGFETTNAHIERRGRSIPKSNFERLRDAFFRRETCVRNRESGEMWILSPPDLSGANGVVGLDGTPTPILWDLVLDLDFEHREVLSESERETYFAKLQNYTIKKANDAARHNSSGRNMTPEFDRALFEYIDVNESGEPCLVAPDSSLDELEERGLLESVKDERNFAEIRSSNAFEGERLGVIPYALHPGDDTIKRWGALLGRTVTPNRVGEVSYGRVGDKIYHHIVHNRILQAIYRFGRDGAGATVYVATGATPSWIRPDERIQVSPFRGEKKRAVANILRRNPSQGFTDEQIAGRLDCSDSHVRKAFNELRDEGYVDSTLGYNGKKKVYWVTS